MFMLSAVPLVMTARAVSGRISGAGAVHNGVKKINNAGALGSLVVSFGSRFQIIEIEPGRFWMQIRGY